MATEDSRVILNPYSNADKDAVYENEDARLFMREQKYKPGFLLTERQRQAFKGTPYEQDEEALKHSIISRILTGDPSAQDYTDDQAQAARYIKRNK